MQSIQRRRSNRPISPEPRQSRIAVGHFLSAIAALLFLLAEVPWVLAEDASAKGADALAPRGDVVTVPIGYLEQEVKRPLPLSRLNVAPQDLGVAGAQIALKDNNTTGRFTKQQFTLEVERVPPDGDAVAALAKLVASGHHFVLVGKDAAHTRRLRQRQRRAAV